MSCFIVSDSLLDTIFRYIDINQSTPEIRYLIEREAHYGYPEDRAAHYSHRGSEMLALNIAAYNHRYPQENIEPDHYSFTSLAPAPHLLTVIKALDCWLYQCSEGDTPETACFKHWETFNNRLKSYYVTSQPEYEAAPWG
jgi:hypothetical protein